ncbi:hypothetical protein CYMTET_8689 [Cymbomonas tetramitiformis]|uniref:Uncharacterized protein n=1 Tax=Cymbomonas tetramitiformis TaxID=36881 RepID=A0AAE0GT28_9CHLO|nr:hypothetical protein CYMTET_8689 [Cymbomonas tetramitiformis]
MEKYTRNTKEMAGIEDWPAQIKTLHEEGNSLKEIMRLLSMYPLANQMVHFANSGVEWTKQEKEILGLRQEGED